MYSKNGQSGPSQKDMLKEFSFCASLVYNVIVRGEIVQIYSIIKCNHCILQLMTKL